MSSVTVIEHKIKSEEKDMGVYITSDLKPSRRCAKASQKAVSDLGKIKRNFRSIKIIHYIIGNT